MAKVKLFIGIYPAGISYCDRTKEEHGDYKKIAFLSYSTLKLEIYDNKSNLLDEIKEDAATMKKGEKFEISASGQYIILGENAY